MKCMAYSGLGKSSGGESKGGGKREEEGGRRIECFHCFATVWEGLHRAAERHHSSPLFSSLLRDGDSALLEFKQKRHWMWLFSSEESWFLLSGPFPEQTVYSISVYSVSVYSISVYSSRSSLYPDISTPSWSAVTMCEAVSSYSLLAVIHCNLNW